MISKGCTPTGLSTLGSIDSVGWYLRFFCVVFVFFYGIVLGVFSYCVDNAKFLGERYGAFHFRVCATGTYIGLLVIYWFESSGPRRTQVRHVRRTQESLLIQC